MSNLGGLRCSALPDSRHHPVCIIETLVINSSSDHYRYQAQVTLLTSVLRPIYGLDLEIGTVDGMQGREKDAVIITLVRSNDQVGRSPFRGLYLTDSPCTPSERSVS